MVERMVMFETDVRHNASMIDFLDFLRSAGLDVRVRREEQYDRVCIIYPEKKNRPSTEQQVEGLFYDDSKRRPFSNGF